MDEMKTTDVKCIVCKKVLGQKTFGPVESKNGGTHIKTLSVEWNDELRVSDNVNRCMCATCYKKEVDAKEKDRAERARIRAEKCLKREESTKKHHEEVSVKILTNFFRNSNISITGVLGVVIGPELVSIHLQSGEKRFTPNKEFSTNAPVIFPKRNNGPIDYNIDDFYPMQKERREWLRQEWGGGA